jgi:hypothetical protein
MKVFFLLIVFILIRQTETQSTPCTGSTYSYGGASCSSCPTGATIVTGNARGCTPSSTLTPGPSDSLVFYLSGTSTEGVSAFPNAPTVSYVTSTFGESNGALTLTSGSSLSLTPSVGSALLSVLPTGNSAWSASAWVKCASGGSPQFLSWGGFSFFSATLSVCDLKWHHVAFTHGDGSTTTSKTYIDGALVSTISQTFTIQTDGTSSLVLGSKTLSVPGTYTFSGSPGVSTCPAGVSSFVSSSLPCAPVTGPSDTSFYFSCDEAEGTGAYSVTNPSGITFVADRFGTPGRALQLNNAFFATPLSLPLSVGNAARSIAMFVSCSSGSGFTPLISWGSEGKGSGMVFATDQSMMRWTFWLIDINYNGVCDNLWHHWAATYDGSKVVLYFDGNLISTTLISETVNTASGTTLKIGASPSTNYGDRCKNTRFDDIRIYNRALSLTEIADIFKSQSPFAGSLFELRFYNRALASSEIFTMSQPLFFAATNAVLTSSPSTDATSYAFSCPSGARGNGGTFTQSSIDRSWSWSPRPLCDYCPPGTYLPAGAFSCSLCPSGYYGNRAGLTSPTCSGPCPVPSECPAGTAYPPSSLSTLSCASGGARAIPSTLGMRLWPAAHPTNPQKVDLIVAPLNVCEAHTHQSCSQSSSVSMGGVTLYTVGTAADLHMEPADDLTCSVQ